ncbi:MAG TPA: TRAP transporter large permease [Syntrophales bacterium]|nr:TRAP transporter large permease [Syntrophales bacterium]HNS53693.1 TRAP transporter large permease [Syntrophales bacterium]
MESALLFGLFIAALVLGVPVATSLAAVAFLLIWQFDLGIRGISPNFYAGIAKFQLLAIPFFILAGLIMERCGISRRLVHLISLVVGPIPGGLAIVTVVVGLIFAGISGSGPADTAALGTILISAMAARGYAKPFTAALIASSGSLAIIVPPSIALILYGVITGTSISALFAAGAIPGILVGLLLIIPCFVISWKNGWRGERWGTPAEIWKAFTEAVWGLAAPFIILGGMYGGVFTPTEAAVFAVFYGLFVGMVIHRELHLPDLYALLRDAVLSSAVIMIIVAFAGLYSWTGSTLGVMDTFSGYLLTVSQNPWVVLFMINVILFAAGMLMDAISIYYIFLPILIPIIRLFDWDPVWFGVVMTVNLAIGQLTPPVAVNLYVVCNLAQIRLEEISRAIVPFILAMLLALGIVTAFPALSTFLPELFGLR